MTWDTRRLMSLRAIWNQKYCERNTRVRWFSHDVSLESNHVISHQVYIFYTLLTTAANVTQYTFLYYHNYYTAITKPANGLYKHWVPRKMEFPLKYYCSLRGKIRIQCINGNKLILRRPWSLIRSERHVPPFNHC